MLFGYATPLPGDWSVDAFFLYRTSKDFIEDQPTVLPASTFVVDNLDNAFRKYRAFTVELSRPLRDKWSLTASYALTRLWGNFDLDYAASAVFNTSSILQDGPGVFVEDRFREGPLSQDRTHVLKIFAAYVPTPRLTFGGYLRAQSGQPWEARGRDWYDGYRRYLEPAGTNRNDAWTNVDILTAYKLRFGGRTPSRSKAASSTCSTRKRRSSVTAGSTSTAASGRWTGRRCPAIWPASPTPC